LTGATLAAKRNSKLPGKFADMQKDTVEVNDKQQLTTAYFTAVNATRRLTNT